MNVSNDSTGTIFKTIQAQDYGMVFICFVSFLLSKNKRGGVNTVRLWGRGWEKNAESDRFGKVLEQPRLQDNGGHYSTTAISLLPLLPPLPLLPQPVPYAS